MEKYIVREYENGKIVDEILFHNYPIAFIVHDYLLRQGKESSFQQVR
jgi:hypothetical protein